MPTRLPSPPFRFRLKRFLNEWATFFRIVWIALRYRDKLQSIVTTPTAVVYLFEALERQNRK